MSFKKVRLQCFCRQNKPCYHVMRFSVFQSYRSLVRRSSSGLQHCFVHRKEVSSSFPRAAWSSKPTVYQLSVWDPLALLHCRILIGFNAVLAQQMLCDRSQWFQAPRASDTIVWLLPLINNESPRRSFVVNILHMGKGRISYRLPFCIYEQQRKCNWMGVSGERIAGVSCTVEDSYPQH